MADLANTTDSTINKLEKGQMQLDIEWIDRLAAAFGVHPLAVISDEVPAILPHRSEARPYDVKKGDPLERLVTSTRKLWVIESDALDELGLFKDAIVLTAMDDGTQQLTTGVPVIVDVYARTDDAKPLTLAREFIEPSLLVTNSSTANAMPINMKNVRTVVRGHILHHIRSVARKTGSH